MAEEETTQNEDDEELSLDEAEELARLLDAEEGEGGGGGAEGDGEGDEDPAKPGKKKKLILFAGIALIVLGGAAFYFFGMSGEEPELPPEEVTEESPAEGEGVEEDDLEVPAVQKVNIYKLSPFFIPLRDGNRETGEFVKITPSLQLSNNQLVNEIVKVLPLIRKSIYALLKKKKPSDFKKPQGQIEERLKKEILTSANTLLISGTGTITDVFFTEFIIRSM